jgi:hypothetical protein
MTAPVAQFENRLSSNPDAPHSHDHGEGHAGHSHDQAAEEHGHTHEHMEHAGESLSDFVRTLARSGEILHMRPSRGHQGLESASERNAKSHSIRISIRLPSWHVEEEIRYTILCTRRRMK